jgi:hypothetical protein
MALFNYYGLYICFGKITTVDEYMLSLSIFVSDLLKILKIKYQYIIFFKINTPIMI